MNQPTEIDRGIRVDEAAAVLGYSRVTVHKFLSAGKLARFGRTTSRVSCRSIREFLSDPEVRLVDIQNQAKAALLERRQHASSVKLTTPVM